MVLYVVSSSLNSDKQNGSVYVDVDIVGSKAKRLVGNKRERRLRVASYMEFFRVV